MFANDAKHHQRDYHRRQHNILILSLFIADKSDMDDKIALKMHTNKNFPFFDIMKNSILFSIKLDNNKSSLIRPHFHEIWTICIYDKTDFNHFTYTICMPRKFMATTSSENQ